MNATDCLNKEEKMKEKRIDDANETDRGSSTASTENSK